MCYEKQESFGDVPGVPRDASRSPGVNGRVHGVLMKEKLSRIDTVTLSSDGTALMAIDGKPDANLRLRYGMPLEQAQSASFEAASQQAYDALSRQRANEQALAAQREREQPRDPNPPGPVLG